MKIGVFGGTFNPPHIGHLIVVESVRDQLQLDRVLFIPSSSPPNKLDHTVAPARHRLEMTRLAIDGAPAFELSDIEARRGGVSYTVETLRELSTANPRAELCVLIGADNLAEFQTWKSPDDILSVAQLVAMARPGYEKQSGASKFDRLATFVHVPQIGISSTEIRRRVKMGRSIRYLVPKNVEEYIGRTGLYRDGS
jgi:nicotinate-nucleotide adenylyltransferase